MPSCDGSQAVHRTPARHGRPSRFRCSPDCSTPLRLAAHVGLQPRTRKSHRFRWEGFARATPETGPAPGVPTTIRSNKLPAALLRPSEERRAVRARAFRRVAVTTTEPQFAQSLDARPELVTVRHRSGRAGGPVPFTGSRRVAPSRHAEAYRVRRIAAGIDPHCWPVSLVGPCGVLRASSASTAGALSS